MRTKNTPFQVTVPNKREPISGLVTTAMAAGALVQIKAEASPTDDNAQPTLVAADGTGRVAILEQKVLSKTDWETAMKRNPDFVNEIRTSVPVNSAVTARFAHEAEFEGTDYFTGITASSTAGTPLKIASGKFVAATLITERVHAHLGRLVVPHDSTSFRWTVDFVG